MLLLVLVLVVLLRTAAAAAVLPLALIPGHHHWERMHLEQPQEVYSLPSRVLQRNPYLGLREWVLLLLLIPLL
jgi:hypothetical protein